MMYAALDEAGRTCDELQDAMRARIAGLVETDLVATASELTRGTAALSASEAIHVRLATLLSSNLT